MIIECTDGTVGAVAMGPLNHALFCLGTDVHSLHGSSYQCRCKEVYRVLTSHAHQSLHWTEDCQCLQNSVLVAEAEQRVARVEHHSALLVRIQMSCWRPALLCLSISL